jgi:flagellar hook-basal body complex protein FliE
VIPAIGAIGSALGTLATSATGAAQAPQAVGTDAAAGSSGSSFATVLSNSIQKVQDAQTNSDQLGVQAATGDLQDVHAYTIAATEANLETQLTVALRDKAVDAFNEILRMQA